MKIRVVTDIDMETGAYELSFDNLSVPGSPIDYEILGPVLRRVIDQLDAGLAEEHETVQRKPDSAAP